MYFFITMFLAAVCLIGDSLLTTSHSVFLRAVVDNCTHSTVALLSWLIVVLKCHKRSTILVNSIFELMLCSFLASVIDIDHFFLAKSFKLKQATSLGKRRPLLHCTTFPLLLLATCLSLGWILDSARIWRFGWLAWVSIFSHHIRDASRRGLWVWPFGSTAPVPNFVYMLITLGMPYMVMIPLKDYKTQSPFVNGENLLTV